LLKSIKTNDLYSNRADWGRVQTLIVLKQAPKAVYIEKRPFLLTLTSFYVC